MNTLRRRGDDGLGLTELLVAATLTSVLLALLAGVFISDLRTTSRISAKVDATADARLVADTVARRLRVAGSPDTTTAPTAFVGPLTANAVTFYASIAGGALGGGAPGETDGTWTKVDYRIVTVVRDGQDTGCVQETLTPGVTSPTGETYPAAGQIRRCLAFGTVNADGRPLFTYLASGTGADQVTGVNAVRSVQVAVTVTAARGDQRATTAATTRVSLPNTCTVGASSC